MIGDIDFTTPSLYRVTPIRLQKYGKFEKFVVVDCYITDFLYLCSHTK